MRYFEHTFYFASYDNLSRTCWKKLYYFRSHNLPVGVMTAHLTILVAFSRIIGWCPFLWFLHCLAMLVCIQNLLQKCTLLFWLVPLPMLITLVVRAVLLTRFSFFKYGCTDNQFNFESVDRTKEYRREFLTIHLHPDNYVIASIFLLHKLKDIPSRVKEFIYV